MWDKSSKIIILGGGPVGLSTAYQLWLMNFKNITVIEKRKEYTRKQIITLNVQTWGFNFPKEVIDKLLKKEACYNYSASTQAEPNCIVSYSTKEFKHFSYPIIVKINSLEKEMLKYMKNKIKIIINDNIILDNKLITVNKLKIPYDILIGADGSKSTVRKKWFKTISVKIPNISQIVYAIIYYKPPKSITSKFMTHNYISKFETVSLNFPNEQLRSRISVLKDSSIMLSLMIFEKTTISSLKKLIDNTFTLYNMDHKIQKYQTGEIIKFPLNFYKSNKYIQKNAAGNTVALVGDAAFNTHFFSGYGLNIGVILSTLLILSPEKYNELGSDMQKYSQYLINSNFINIKKIQKKCKEYTYEHLIDLLTSEKRLIKKKNVEHLNKDELCLYLENTLLREDYYKSISNQPIHYPSHSYFTDLIEKDFYNEKIKQIRNKYQKLFDVALEYEKKHIEDDLISNKSNITDFNPKEEPDKNNMNYSVWLAHKDFKTKNPYKTVRQRIDDILATRNMHLFKFGILLQKFKNNKIYENFLNIYIMLASYYYYFNEEDELPPPPPKKNKKNL